MENNFNKWNPNSTCANCATPAPAVINNTPAPIAVLPITPAKPSLMKRVCTKKNAIIAGGTVLIGFGLYEGYKVYKKKKEEIKAKAEQTASQVEAFANALQAGAAAMQAQQNNAQPANNPAPAQQPQAQQAPAQPAPAATTQTPPAPQPKGKKNKK